MTALRPTPCSARGRRRAASTSRPSSRIASLPASTSADDRGTRFGWRLPSDTWPQMARSSPRRPNASRSRGDHRLKRLERHDHVAGDLLHPRMDRPSGERPPFVDGRGHGLAHRVELRRARGVARQRDLDGVKGVVPRPAAAEPAERRRGRPVGRGRSARRPGWRSCPAAAPAGRAAPPACSAVTPQACAGERRHRAPARATAPSRYSMAGMSTPSRPPLVHASLAASRSAAVSLKRRGLGGERDERQVQLRRRTRHDSERRVGHHAQRALGRR